VADVALARARPPAGDGGAVLEAEGLRKEFGDVVAVDGVDLRVPPAGALAIVGESGSGKTTVAKMIVGLERPTAGTIRACGRDRSTPSRTTAERRRRGREVQIVFQDPYTSLDPRQTVERTLDEVLRLHGDLDAEARRARVRELGDLVGLDARQIRALPRSLSGGQRQRVAIGRAIVRQPRVFLFDEPLSNLDAKLRVQMRREIARIRRELSATVVYVTHDQVEAMTLGDRIVVMNEGRVEQIGSPLELYDHPRTLFVATFIGSPAMNLVEGQFLLDDTPRFVATEGRGFSIPLSPEQSSRARGMSGKALVAGIRPEDLHARPAHEGATGNLSAAVDAIEPLGNEVLLYLRGAGQELTVRADPRVLPRAGDVIGLAIDPARVHYFDRSTGSVLGST
jgi:multiple sugar transport system ATP-binding protein